LELKSLYRLVQFPSRKRAAVEAFIYATIITMLASRRLWSAVRRKLQDRAHRIGELRWAQVFRAHAQQILQVMLAPPRHVSYLAKGVEATMLHEAVDPHRNRPGLIEQVEKGTSWRPVPA
jgi:hypothetical protein